MTQPYWKTCLPAHPYESHDPAPFADADMTPPSAPRHLDIIAGGLLGLAIILLIHRYPGINHDSSLYLGQAMHRLWPNIFQHDLFFAYGSQDSFTLMPWVVSKLHPHLSFPDIFLIGTLLSLLLFAFSAWYFLARILPREQRYWAWLAALCLPGVYGVIRVFTYGEPFFTARPVAEGLTLLALGLMARKRLLPALLCVAAAALLHPLQAIGAMLIVWPWLVLHDRRWLHLAWLALPVLALGFTHIKPFNGLFLQIDALWMKDLADFTRQLFITHWYTVDLANLAFDILMLCYASWRLRNAFGHWCMAGLIGLLLGVVASLVLVDVLHLLLPAALQLWRAQWLAHLLANAAVGVLLFQDLKSGGDAKRASVLALATLMACTGFLWTWIPVFALYATWPVISPRMTSKFRITLMGLCIAMLLGVFIFHVADEWLPFRLAHYRLDLYAIDRRIIAFPLLALGLPLLGLYLWELCPRGWQQAGLTGLALVLVVLGVARWDARSPVARALEARSFSPDLFGASLPADAQVFWDLPMYPAVWVALKRADYFSPWQLAGSVFNRGTPQEGRLRLERIRPVIEEDMYCQDRSVPLKEREHCRISEASLRQACGPGPNSPPDYLVLPYRQDQSPLGQWSVIDPVTGEAATTFWLYACRTVMHELPPLPSSLTEKNRP